MKRKYWFILIVFFIYFFPAGVSAENVVKITSYSYHRSNSPLLDDNGNPFVLYAGSTSLGTTKLGNFLKSSENFGVQGVVPCSITFEKPINEVSDQALVDSQGNLNADVFFATDISSDLSNTEIEELNKFLNHGGILYVQGTYSGGNQYLPLLQRIGTDIHFSDPQYEPTPTYSANPIGISLAINGPFGSVGSILHGPYKSVVSNTANIVAYSQGLGTNILVDTVAAKGYLSVSGGPLHINVLANADNIRYFSNLISLACDKSWQDSSVVLDVPSFKQGLAPYDDSSPVWENDTYDDGGVLDLDCDTNGDGAKMAECACALTSANMVMAYYGLSKGDNNEDLLPGLLNTYSKAALNDGIFAGFVNGNFRWDYVGNLTAQLNKDNPGQPKLDQPVREDYSLDRVKELIDSGIPVILRVNNGNHWVVVKGYNPDTNKLIINDPSSIDPISGEYQYLEDLYTPDGDGSMIVYALASSDYRYLQFAAASDIHLSVLNSKGEKTGYDTASGQTKSEIPNSDYVVDPYYSRPDSGAHSTGGMRLLTIKLPENGEYKLQIVSQDSSIHPVYIYSSDREGNLAGEVLSDKSLLVTVLYDESRAGESIQIVPDDHVNIEPKKKKDHFVQPNKKFPVSIERTEREESKKKLGKFMYVASYILRNLKSWLKF